LTYNSRAASDTDDSRDIRNLDVVEHEGAIERSAAFAELNERRSVANHSVDEGVGSNSLITSDLRILDAKGESNLSIVDRDAYST
jgi:hypothetical protein